MNPRYHFQLSRQHHHDAANPIILRSLIIPENIFLLNYCEVKNLSARSVVCIGSSDSPRISSAGRLPVLIKPKTMPKKQKSHK